jgi:hypothetical protein
MDVPVYQGICLRGAIRPGIIGPHEAINRQLGPAGEGSRIERVHEDLPVVSEKAEIYDKGGAYEDYDQAQFKENDYLSVLSVAVPS